MFELDVLVRPTSCSASYQQCKLIFSDRSERCTVFLKFENVYLQYNTRNLVPGKDRIRNTTHKEIQSHLPNGFEWEQGGGQITILFLTLVELCPVLHPVPVVVSTALAEFSSQKELQIVLDWKQLGPDKREPFKKFLKHPETLRSFYCILPQLDNEHNWAISSNIKELSKTTHYISDLGTEFLFIHSRQLVMLDPTYWPVSEDPPVYTANCSLKETQLLQLSSGAPTSPSNKYASLRSADYGSFPYLRDITAFIEENSSKLRKPTELESLADTVNGNAELLEDAESVQEQEEKENEQITFQCHHQNNRTEEDSKTLLDVELKKNIPASQPLPLPSVLPDQRPSNLKRKADQLSGNYHHGQQIKQQDAVNCKKQNRSALISQSSVIDGGPNCKFFDVIQYKHFSNAVAWLKTAWAVRPDAHEAFLPELGMLAQAAREHDIKRYDDVRVRCMDRLCQHKRNSGSLEPFSSEFTVDNQTQHIINFVYRKIGPECDLLIVDELIALGEVARTWKQVDKLCRNDEWQQLKRMVITQMAVCILVALYKDNQDWFMLAKVSYEDDRFF